MYAQSRDTNTSLGFQPLGDSDSNRNQIPSSSISSQKLSTATLGLFFLVTSFSCCLSRRVATEVEGHIWHICLNSFFGGDPGSQDAESEGSASFSLFSSSPCGGHCYTWEGSHTTHIMCIYTYTYTEYINKCIQKDYMHFMRFVLKPKYDNDFTCFNKHPDMRTTMTKPSHFTTILSLASFPHPCHSIHCEHGYQQHQHQPHRED